jgi:hypothetical protein
MQACRGTDVAEADIHLWQQCNPVVTEALVQLTWGGPQVIYNGGLQQARVRYYDADRRRPGLPESVAALVRRIDPQATVVDLVNLDPEQERTVVVQAGAFAEHTIEAVRYTACQDRAWLGSLYDYGHTEPAVTERDADIRGPWLTVHLPPSTRIRLTLTLGLRTRPPSYATPYDVPSEGGVSEGAAGLKQAGAFAPRRLHDDAAGRWRGSRDHDRVGVAWGLGGG